MEGQFTKYFAKLDRDLEDLSLGGEFEDAAGNLKRDVNVLVLLAMALGQSEEGSSLKDTAGIVHSGKQILDSADADGAAQAVKAMQSAASAASGKKAEWEKAAQLAPLMSKVVPSLTTEIKRLSKNEKTLLRAGNSEKVAGDAASLAVVALGSRLSAAETKAPNEEALWKEYCAQLCASSLKLNEAANALRDGGASYADFSAALKEVEATCSGACHEKFSGAK